MSSSGKSGRKDHLENRQIAMAEEFESFMMGGATLSLDPSEEGVGEEESNLEYEKFMAKSGMPTFEELLDHLRQRGEDLRSTSREILAVEFD